MGLLDILGLRSAVARTFGDWLGTTLGRAWPPGGDRKDWDSTLAILVELDQGIDQFHAKHGVRAFRKAVWHYLTTAGPEPVNASMKALGDSTGMRMLVTSYQGQRGHQPKGILLLRNTLQELDRLPPPTTGTSVAPAEADIPGQLAAAVRQFEEEAGLPSQIANVEGTTADQVWWEMAIVRLFAVRLIVGSLMPGARGESLLQQVYLRMATASDGRQVVQGAWIANAVADYFKKLSASDGADPEALAAAIGTHFARRMKSDAPAIGILGAELYKDAVVRCVSLIQKS